MFDIEGVDNYTFLVYKSNEKNIDSFGLGMMMNNAIDGFLPFSCIQKDEDKVLNYNITSMISLEQYMENYLKKDQILNIFISITRGVISAEEFMLDISKLLLDKKYIYIEVNNNVCKLLYLPIKEGYSELGLVNAFKNLCMEIKYDSNDDTAYVTELINYLSVNPQLDCRKFEQWLAVRLSDNEQSKQEITQIPKAKEVQPESENVYTDKRLIASQQMVKNSNTPLPSGTGLVSPQEETDSRHKKFAFLLGNGKKEEKEQDKNSKKKEKQPKQKNKKEPKERFSLSSERGISAIVPSFNIPGQDREQAVQKRNIENNDLKYNNVRNDANDIMCDNVNRNVSSKNTTELEEANEMSSVNSGNLDFGETVILSNNNDDDTITTILSATNVNIFDGMPYLERIKNGQKVYIDKDVIKIGRGSGYTDFYIGDNPCIGRSHADIIRENNEYYIRDNNSNNHTYVEGKMVLGGQRDRLSHGTKIALADEEFIFYLY